MAYRVLAEAVVLAHFAFIGFAALGGLAALRWPWAPWVHLPAVAWGVWIELTGGICPLTPLEIALRRAAGEAGYGSGFIAHYLLPVLYPAGLTPAVQQVLAAILVAVNVAVYALVWARRRRGRPGGPRC